MRRRACAFVCLAGGLATAGCAAKAPRPLDHDALRASRPQTLVVVERASPAMTAEGPEKEGPDARRLLGLVGAVVIAGSERTANRRRARWMKGCESEDPVGEIRETIGEDFATALSLHLLASDHRTSAKDADDVISDHPGADLILDIRTSKWGIHRIEAPSRWGEVHFAVGYAGWLRLIDSRTRTVVVETTCSVQFSNGNAPPILNELFADDCALLDKGLAVTSETCTKRLRAALGLL